LNSRVFKTSLDNTNNRYQKFDNKQFNINVNKNTHQDYFDNTIKEIETNSSKIEKSISTPNKELNLNNNISMAQHPHNTTNSTDVNYNAMKNEINRLQKKVNFLIKDKKIQEKDNEIKIKNDEEYSSNKISIVNENPSHKYNNNKTKSISEKSKRGNTPIQITTSDNISHFKHEIDSLQSNIDGLEDQLCNNNF